MCEVDKAISALQSSYLTLSNAITGRSSSSPGNNNNRYLFTNSYPKLGLLTNTLHEISQTFLSLNENYSSLQTLFQQEMSSLLSLFQENYFQKNNFKKQFESLSENYKQQILTSLSSRNISNDLENEICQLRMEMELHRFDYVAKLNQNNCYKKFLLTKVQHLYPLPPPHPTRPLCNSYTPLPHLIPTDLSLSFPLSTTL